MTSGARALSPESESLLKDVTEKFQNTVSHEELHFLLTDHEAWERFVAKATLSREEAEALREGLNELLRAMDMEPKEQQARERFLSEFPGLKVELEEHIRKLHELADEVDRVHRDCTVTNVVASSVGTASGVLSILGLVLAPFTAGASLTLSAVGAGLGAAAAVTQVSTSLVERSRKSSATAKASHLISSDTDKKEVVEKVLCPHIDLNPSSITTLGEKLEVLTRSVHAIRVARVNPQLVVPAQRLTRGLPVSARTARLVQNSFRGTALAMSRGARVMGVATAGLSLAVDMYNLVKDSGHLLEGAKTASAEEMRRQARELERKLEELTIIYGILKKGRTP